MSAGSSRPAWVVPALALVTLAVVVSVVVQISRRDAGGVVWGTVAVAMLVPLWWMVFRGRVAEDGSERFFRARRRSVTAPDAISPGQTLRVVPSMVGFFALMALVNAVRQEWWLVAINVVGLVLLAGLWAALRLRGRR